MRHGKVEVLQFIFMVSSMSDDARERGQARYEQLFGKKRKFGPDDTSLDEFTVDHLFANVWSRPQLEMRQRSMITVALLAALGREHELVSHIKGARRLGITAEEVIELMI